MMVDQPAHKTIEIYLSFARYIYIYLYPQDVITLRSTTWYLRAQRRSHIEKMHRT